MRPLLLMIALALSVIGCGDGDAAPTAPTPGPTPAPTTPTTASLTGTVSTTSGQRIGAATVTALDGPNAGQSVQANANGEFRFESLTIATVNFVARAAGHLDDRRGVAVNGTNTLNFTLSPVPAITITTRFVSGGPGVLPQEWAFTATSNVSFATYDWDFGDGFTAANRGPQEQHVYRTRGRYRVTATGRNPDGSSLVATLDIDVI